MYRKHLLVAGLAIAVLLAGSASQAAKKPVEKILCDVAVLPAATLLIPYFETDITATTGADFTTLGAVTNVGTRTWVVHVTLWTDWAIPTMSFDLVLRPNDVQTFDLHEWLFVGPQATSVPAAGCTGNLAPGRIHLSSGISAGATLEETLANVRYAHEGQAFAGPNGEAVASSSHPGVAIGYVTFDVANRCSDGFPSTKDYFKAGGKGVASNVNALVGDVFLIDNVNGRGETEPAVHIRASGAFAQNNYTFYGRYVSGKALDGRQPLGNIYGSRYVADIPIAPNAQPETDLIIWRDIKSTLVSPLAAGKQPYWVSKMTTAPILIWDEQAHGVPIVHNVGLATQKVAVGRGDGIDTPYDFGWLKLNLNHVVPYKDNSNATYFGNRAQGWVSTIYRANVLGSPASGAFQAFRLSTVCTER